MEIAATLNFPFSILNYSLFANCPQAASMSFPRLRRTVTIIPLSFRYRANRSILSAPAFVKSRPSTGLYSMMLTRTGKRWQSFYSATASASPSLKSLKAMYS